MVPEEAIGNPSKDVGVHIKKRRAAHSRALPAEMPARAPARSAPGLYLALASRSMRIERLRPWER